MMETEKIFHLVHLMTGSADEARSICCRIFSEQPNHDKRGCDPSLPHLYLYRMAKDICFFAVEKEGTHREYPATPLGLIRRLSKYQRIIFILNSILDVPIPDVAQVIIKPKSAVRILALQAQRKVLTLLEKGDTCLPGIQTLAQLKECLLDSPIEEVNIPLSSGLNTRS